MRADALQIPGAPDLSQAPPFTLADLKRAIPQHCWQKDSGRSIRHLIKDVAIVVGLAVAAYSLNAWYGLELAPCTLAAIEAILAYGCYLCNQVGMAGLLARTRHNVLGLVCGWA